MMIDDFRFCIRSASGCDLNHRLGNASGVLIGFPALDLDLDLDLDVDIGLLANFGIWIRIFLAIFVGRRTA